jgi:uncharacterized RmlC-like cupin family protein
MKMTAIPNKQNRKGWLRSTGRQEWLRAKPRPRIQRRQRLELRPPVMTDQEPFMDAVIEYPPIRIVSPAVFDSGTAQTSGSVRLAAVAPQLGVQSVLWGGLFEVEPGARTGIHHHGEQQTVAYVLSGICEVRWGARGEHAARAKAGDFIHVPAFLPHMEINPSDSEAFRWVVVRSTSTPIVVNLPDNTWP